MRKATLIVDGNMFAVAAEPALLPDIRARLEQALRFPYKVSADGMFTTEWEQMCRLDNRGRVTTLFGFFELVVRVLRGAGYQVFQRDVGTPKKKRQDAYTPNWANAKGVQWRPRQLEAMQRIVAAKHGLVNAAPGFGKSYSFGIFCQVMSRARIGIVSRSVDVVGQIHRDLCDRLAGVELITGSARDPNPSARVYVSSTGSAHRLPADLDYLLIDEIHESAADNESQQFVHLRHARIFGFSGSIEMRADGKDYRVTALCGPVIFEMSPQEAVALGLTTQIKVIYREVKMSRNPCGHIRHMTVRKQVGLWRNDVRNRMIAEDARKYPGEQVLITTESVEHAFRLKQLLPDFALVYAPGSEPANDPDRRRAMVADGSLPANHTPMTNERRKRLTQDFSAGRLRRAIVTTVWNRGVNFPALGVLIRADGARSKIAATQIPARTNRKFGGKDVAIVRDYRDTYDDGFDRAFSERTGSYRKQGFIVEMEPDADSLASLWGEGGAGG